MDDGIYEVGDSGSIALENGRMIMTAIISQICKDIRMGELPLDDEITQNTFVPCFEDFSFEFMRAINMKLNENNKEAREYIGTFIDECEERYIAGRKDLNEFSNKQALGGL